MTTGASPEGVLVSDLNGDSKLDLASANQSGYTVSVFLGNGDGTFQPRQDTVTKQAPFGIVAGDFTGDHKMDIAAISFDVELLVGNGDGTFQNKGVFGAGVSSRTPVVGRYNQDATDDIAVLNYGYYDHTYSVSVLLGNPNGSFRTRRDYPTTVGKPGSGIYVALADFNNDAKNDAVTINDGMTVLLANGDGTFQSPLASPTGVAPYRFAIGDFNGDGKIDTATLNQNDFVNASVSVLLGNGNGTFQPHLDFVVGAFPDSIVVGDLNGDQFSDIVICQSDGQTSTLSVFLSKGDGSFNAATTIPLTEGAAIAAISDINGDSSVDLLVLTSTVEVFLGNGDGTFGSPQNYVTGSISSRADSF